MADSTFQRCQWVALLQPIAAGFANFQQIRRVGRRTTAAECSNRVATRKSFVCCWFRTTSTCNFYHDRVKFTRCGHGCCLAREFKLSSRGSRAVSPISCSPADFKNSTNILTPAFSRPFISSMAPFAKLLVINGVPAKSPTGRFFYR